MITKLERSSDMQDKEIEKLKTENSELLNTIEVLDNKINELEQYSKLDNLIITGLTILKPFNKTSLVTRVDNKTKEAETKDSEMIQIGATEESTDTWSNRDKSIMTDNILKFAKSKLNVELKPSDIMDIHAMQARNTRNKQSKDTNESKSKCIVRFSNRVARDKIYGVKKQLRGTGVYINEHLTKENARIFRMARELRSKGKLQNVSTRNCRVLVKTKENKIEHIQSKSFFNAYD